MNTPTERAIWALLGRAFFEEKRVRNRIEIAAGLLILLAALVIGVRFAGARHTLEVLPREQDFGTIRAGENVSRSYRLVNYTDRPIDILSIGAG